MKNFGKALLVVFGFLIIVIGILTTGISIFNDFTLSYRILGIIGGIILMLLGAFMMRKGSNSIGDAISTFFALFIPW